MKVIKNLSLALVCITALGFGAAVADAAAAGAAQPAAKAEAAASERIGITFGKITSIEDGMCVIEGEGTYNKIAAVVDEDTYVIEGKNGHLRRPSALQVGQEVTAYYSPRVTRSIPPQSHAGAIVVGKLQLPAPAYVEIGKATLSEDGSYITLVDGSYDLIITVNAAACKDYAKIKCGDKLLLWSTVNALSEPARTNADKVIVLP